MFRVSGRALRILVGVLLAVVVLGGGCSWRFFPRSRAASRSHRFRS